jgi:hypothetical protein
MKTELQRLADQTGLALTVAHLPPGTSKWNRIEYRLFDIITHNWRVKPHPMTEVVILAHSLKRGPDGPIMSSRSDVASPIIAIVTRQHGHARYPRASASPRPAAGAPAARHG